MPKGYWIPHLDVSNPQGFQTYREMADAWHRHHGSRLLARGGRREVVEGKMRGRNVLREFDFPPLRWADTALPNIARQCAARGARGLRFPDYRGLRRRAAAASGTPPAAAARKGYWIGHVDVTDPEGYKPYVAAKSAVQQVRRPFSGRRRAREVVEGKVRARTVVLEFPSYEAALACYRSATIRRRPCCVKARPRSICSSSKVSIRRNSESGGQ